MSFVIGIAVTVVVVLVINKLLDEAEHRRMRDLSSQRVSDWNDDIQRNLKWSEDIERDEAERERQGLNSDQKPSFDDWERDEKMRKDAGV